LNECVQNKKTIQNKTYINFFGMKIFVQILHGLLYRWLFGIGMIALFRVLIFIGMVGLL